MLDKVRDEPSVIDLSQTGATSIMHLSVTGRGLDGLGAGYPTTKWVKASNLRRLPLVFLLVTRGVCVKRAGESVCEQCALSAWTKCLPPSVYHQASTTKRLPYLACLLAGYLLRGCLRCCLPSSSVPRMVPPILRRVWCRLSCVPAQTPNNAHPTHHI